MWMCYLQIIIYLFIIYLFIYLFIYIWETQSDVANKSRARRFLKEGLIAQVLSYM